MLLAETAQQIDARVHLLATVGFVGIGVFAIIFIVLIANAMREAREMEKVEPGPTHVWLFIPPEEPRLIGSTSDEMADIYKTMGERSVMVSVDYPAEEVAWWRAKLAREATSA